MLRGHHAHYDGRILKRFSEFVTGRDASRYELAGKKFFVHPLTCDGFANFLVVRPQPHAVSLLAAKNYGKRRPPGSRTDDGDLAHAGFAPIRFSVPASSRRIFSPCLMMMSREVAVINTTGALP